MRLQRRAARAAAALVLVAAVTSPVASTAAAQGRPENPGLAAEHWSAQRRAAAIPRDLVIDDRGRGYLRRPDGTLEPYGQESESPTPPGDQLQASSSPAPRAKPGGAGGGSNDTTPPLITNLDPNAITIAGSYAFTADVNDDSGVRSVTFVIVYPDGSTTQSFSASSAGGSTYSLTLQGFFDGDWSWYVEAKDGAKRGGNTGTSATAPFTVSTGSGDGDGGGGGGDEVITNAPWTTGGAVQTAAGRIYFEMPTNWKKNRWTGYVCSGTTVTDGTTGRSIILTAAHCVYDDANKAFARNVLFIPDQASTSGSGTDLNCSNDAHGCWAPSFGVVDSDWATRTWPNNIAWDYGFYVVDDVGAHTGNGTGDALDGLSSVPVSLANAPSIGASTAALGYSYSDDPDFMYCQEGLGTDGAHNWFLPSCGLSGGASGGPWLQPVNGGDGSIVSVNSYGYSTQPGMGGPKLSGTSASCLFQAAKVLDLASIGSTPSGC